MNETIGLICTQSFVIYGVYTVGPSIGQSIGRSVVVPGIRNCRPRLSVVVCVHRSGHASQAGQGYGATTHRPADSPSDGRPYIRSDFRWVFARSRKNHGQMSDHPTDGPEVCLHEKCPELCPGLCPRSPCWIYRTQPRTRKNSRHFLDKNLLKTTNQERPVEYEINLKQVFTPYCYI